MSDRRFFSGGPVGIGIVDMSVSYTVLDTVIRDEDAKVYDALVENCSAKPIAERVR